MKVPALRREVYFRERGSRVVVHRETRQIDIPQHRHEFLEMVLILSGTGVHVTGAFRHRLQSGDVLVVSRRRTHGYEETRGLNLVNILVRDDVLPRVARELRRVPGYPMLFDLESARWRPDAYVGRLRLHAADLAQVAEWVDRLEEESARPGEGGRLLAEAYLTLIMGLLARRYGGTGLAGRQRETAGMGPLLSWMEAHLADPMTVDLLAARAGMSVRSFHRAFRRATGRTPVDYCLQRRVERARELLAMDPGLRIGEVAARCGFEDSNYFSRVFRERLGKSPRTLRGGGTE
jgi:AraC-like DNA-binding protein